MAGRQRRVGAVRMCRSRSVFAVVSPLRCAIATGQVERLLDRTAKMDVDAISFADLVRNVDEHVLAIEARDSADPDRAGRADPGRLAGAPCAVQVFAPVELHLDRPAPR